MSDEAKPEIQTGTVKSIDGKWTADYRCDGATVHLTFKPSGNGPAEFRGLPFIPPYKPSP